MLEGSAFDHCRFAGCDFTAATFHRCLFDSCRFDNCNLSNLKVSDSVFRNCRFQHSKLIGINWYEIRKRSGSLSMAFDECNLNYSSFTGST